MVTAWFFSPGDRFPIMRYAVSVESKISAIFLAAAGALEAAAGAASSSDAEITGLSEYSSSAASARFSSLRSESSSSELRESARLFRDLAPPPEETLVPLRWSYLV